MCLLHFHSDILGLQKTYFFLLVLFITFYNRPLVLVYFISLFISKINFLNNIAFPWKAYISFTTSSLFIVFSKSEVSSMYNILIKVNIFFTVLHFLLNFFYGYLIG